MSKIQQRIRNLIWQHAWASSNMGCICGFECFPHSHAPHVAEMITTELGLELDTFHGWEDGDLVELVRWQTAWQRTQ